MLKSIKFTQIYQTMYLKKIRASFSVADFIAWEYSSVVFFDQMTSIEVVKNQPFFLCLCIYLPALSFRILFGQGWGRGRIDPSLLSLYLILLKKLVPSLDQTVILCFRTLFGLGGAESTLLSYLCI